MNTTAPARLPVPTPIIAVVIPCFRVRAKILGVLQGIGAEVHHILVVDDACPEDSGTLVSETCRDPRVQVLRHADNQGVGGALCTGYRHALDLRATIVVKLDGDGQMDPALIPALIHPILKGEADYSKGNRFHHLGGLGGMPLVRLIGNAGLSFLTKLSTGYWQSFDPTNGFTAIHRAALSRLPLDRIARRYFFESDMLYHLNQIRAVVCDFPMRAVYGDESSSLSPSSVLLPFFVRHVANFARRVLYGYFVRGFSLASVELLIGTVLCLFGTAFGTYHWWLSNDTGAVASAGTVMLSGLPIIVGVQLLLSWLNFDVAAEPRVALSRLFGED